MNQKIKKGISIKESIALILILMVMFAFNINVFANKPAKEVTILFPDIKGVDKNNQTFIVYDITDLRKKVRMENSSLEYNEMLNKLKLRAERMQVGSEKKEILMGSTKNLEGKDGAVKFDLEDDKTYIIENKNGRAEPILLDYIYDLPDSQEIFAKPVPVEEKVPLKKSGVNRSIFAQILDFVSLILN